MMLRQCVQVAAALALLAIAALAAVAAFKLEQLHVEPAITRCSELELNL